ncbi:hypothetical protein VUN82_08445 [Micrococcaceae bacterium Sec5.1]
MGASSGVSFVPASGVPVTVSSPCSRVFVGVWVVVGGVWLTGLLFENYIVDASI